MSETLEQRIARLSAGTPTPNRLADRMRRLVPPPPLDPVMRTAIDPVMDPTPARAPEVQMDPVVVNAERPPIKGLPAMAVTEQPYS